MKQYVLDEPMAAAPLPAEPQAMLPTQPGWWRSLLPTNLVEAVALANSTSRSSDVRPKAALRRVEP